MSELASLKSSNLVVARTKSLMTTLLSNLTGAKRSKRHSPIIALLWFYFTVLVTILLGVEKRMSYKQV
jgi:hypothetical protein